MVDPSAYGVGVGVGPVVHHRPRCWRCNRMLARYLAEPYSLDCGRCKARNQAGAALSTESVLPSPSTKALVVPVTPAPAPSA